MDDAIDVGALYRDAREDLSGLVRSLSEAQLAVPVPSCPGWSVHGVVSHLAGIAADAIAGKLGGIPDDEFTARQVAERAGTNTNVVLREWERSASQFEIVLSRAGSTLMAPLFDVVVHEHDIRGALDLPGNRSGEVIDRATGYIAGRFVRRVDSAGLPHAAIVDSAGAVMAGTRDAPVHLRIDHFELFRAGFGRRSARQIAARVTGTDDATAYVAHLAIFGPAATDIVE